MENKVNLYFVASPLQYLAARSVASHFEAGARQILIWYKPGVASVVVADDWDATSYMPWPRFYPLPGLAGRYRRLLENIDMVANLVGECDTLQIHSAVFDTEAVNYFLRALPEICGAKSMHARILPDGVISIRRYPLGLLDRIFIGFRKLRRLGSSRLNYWCYSGDRIGSDAPFCDRIYVVPGIPNEYPSEKVVMLPPLVPINISDAVAGQRKALVVGQPLVGAGLIKRTDLEEVSREIFTWLNEREFDSIDYKQHPKDPNLELCSAEYRVLELHEPLETWMARTRYDAVVGVRSSALLFARQVYPVETQVVAFGWDRIKFKSDEEDRAMKNVFTQCGVSIL
jgi:Alpha-2,8-polysialyltransferase (POLYST)